MPGVHCNCTCLRRKYLEIISNIPKVGVKNVLKKERFKWIFGTPCKRWSNPNVNFNTPDSYYVGWSERTTGVNRSINEKNFWQPRKGYRAAR